MRRIVNLTTPLRDDGPELPLSFDGAVLSRKKLPQRQADCVVIGVTFQHSSCVSLDVIEALQVKRGGQQTPFRALVVKQSPPFRTP